MTKFNKNLLTAAVVGALALPSIASAASLSYNGAKQITFAKDLIVNNDTTIYVPRDLALRSSSTDAANIATVTAVNNQVRFKVTLTNGAKFDATADATTLVNGFIVGTELGGTGAAAIGAPGGGTLVGTPYYSASGQELNFTIAVPGPGIELGGAGDYALLLNSMQITNLVQGLGTGSSIGAEITAQNQAGQQILASSATIARSVWGLTFDSLPQGAGFGNYKIDVVEGSDFNRKTRFSPTGAVGGAEGFAANDLWSPGGVSIDVASARLTDNSGPTYVNNYSAVAANPQYNVVATSVFTIQVKGSNLNAFKRQLSGGGAVLSEAYLDTSSSCTGAIQIHNTTNTPVSLNAAGDTITFTVPGNNAVVTNTIGAAPTAGPLDLYVCLVSGTDVEMVAQPLAGTVSVDYKLPTQRVNPPAGTFELAPLQQNGTQIVFQNVNPAGGSTAQSFLRLTNNNGFACPVVIDAKDDAGRHSGEIKLSLDAHKSVQLNSEVLEGNASQTGITGKFGDGTGKWYVRVLAECDFFTASALNRNAQSGTVTDLTPQVNDAWLTPPTKL